GYERLRINWGVDALLNNDDGLSHGGIVPLPRQIVTTPSQISCEGVVRLKLYASLVIQPWVSAILPL
ncbi:MAG: hypothetical protein RIS75_1208, partial [Actinomycetota bacterium]